MTETADVGAGGDPRVYVAGDHLDLVVTVLDADDNPVDITEAEAIRYVITRQGPGGTPVGAPLVSKSLGEGIAITAGAAGQFTVTLANGDTGSLVGTYRHEAEITDEDGRVATLLIGAFGVSAQAILPE